MSFKLLSPGFLSVGAISRWTFGYNTSLPIGENIISTIKPNYPFLAKHKDQICRRRLSDPILAAHTSAVRLLLVSGSSISVCFSQVVDKLVHELRRTGS